MLIGIGQLLIDCLFYPSFRIINQDYFYLCSEMLIFAPELNVSDLSILYYYGYQEIFLNQR